MVVDLVGRADLLDDALVEHRNAVGERKCLLLVVGNVNAGDAEILLHLFQLQTKLHAQLGVEVGQRLIQTDDGRPGDERTGNRHALLLSAGELRYRLFELLVGKIDLFGDGADLFVHLRLAQLLDAQTERDVVVHGHRREERIALEHDADVPLLDGDMGDIPIADEHLPLRRLDEAGDGAERRGLAAAGRAEKCEKLALPDVDVDIVQRGEVAEFDDDVVEPDHSGIPSSLLRNCKVGSIRVDFSMES